MKKQYKLLSLLITYVWLSACHAHSTYSSITSIDVGEYYNSYVTDIAWHPEGDSIAVGAQVAVYLYNTQNKDLQILRKEAGGPQDLEWSSDGRYLAGSRNVLWVWDSSSNEFQVNTNTPHPYNYYYGVSWYKENESIISTFEEANGDARIFYPVLWDISSEITAKVEIPDIESPVFLGGKLSETVFAFRDNSTSSIKFIDLENSTILYEIIESSSPVAWSPDGELFAAVNELHQIIVWDISTQSKIAQFVGYQTAIKDISWHPQGQYLAIAAEDGIYIWNFQTGNSVLVQKNGNPVIEWSPDGTKLATAADNIVTIWEIDKLP